ncbi:MAG: hypothetical protein WD250_13895 [Egibacteraceae bacterium]
MDGGPTAVGSKTGERTQLAEGTELLGAYQGSGSIAVPYLVRRHDGALLQVTHLIHAVATHTDGNRGNAEIAARVGADVGRTLTAQDVAYLYAEKLRPAGLLQGDPDQTQEPSANTPALLALSLRSKVLPDRWVKVATGLLTPLFWSPVVLAVLATVSGVSAWLLVGAHVSQGIAQVLATPAWLLVVAGLTILSGGFHELGHATACRYGGARPGVIGVGLYLIWPAFYNDLTDSYRLSRRGRLRADLGGVYFNGVFILALAAAYGVTGFRPLLVAIAVQYLVVFHQFIPFLRLDGYYLVSDLTGVPDLFARIRPVLSSLAHGRRPNTTLSDLKTGARIGVVAWVLLTVPALLAGMALLLARLPVAAAMGRASFTEHSALFIAAWRAGDPAGAAVSSLQLIVLLLPLVGITVSGARLGAWAVRRRRNAHVTPQDHRLPATCRVAPPPSPGHPTIRASTAPSPLTAANLDWLPGPRLSAAWIYRSWRCDAPNHIPPALQDAHHPTRRLSRAAFLPPTATLLPQRPPPIQPHTVSGPAPATRWPPGPWRRLGPPLALLTRALSHQQKHDRPAGVPAAEERMWFLHPETAVRGGARQPVWLIETHLHNPAASLPTPPADRNTRTLLSPGAIPRSGGPTEHMR